MISFTNEKCIPAALPEICIPRQELMKKLHLARGKRFIYIDSPAGSGKTVTALLWNAAFEQGPKHSKALWLSLDAYDNVPSVFYKLFSAVLFSTQPGNENMHRLLSDPAFSASPVEHTVRLISELLPDECNYSLTLDDLHLINNPDILKSLAIILKRLPGSFIVLFLSRNEIPQPLRVLLRDEKTALVRADALRFSEKELKTYFRSFGRSLTKEECELILMATGGFAIGINAIAKSSLVKETGGALIGSAQKGFANYIRRQLWERWNKELQSFLLKTSIVDEITETLAAKLTRRKDAGKILRELCASNTFVSQSGKDMFRYHHLFLDFLRDMAKESSIKLAPLYKAAAKYYLDSKQYLIAKHYAVQSSDDKIIVQVIYQFNQYTNPALDEYTAYSKIFSLNDLPEGVCNKYPYLYTSIMESAWISGDSAAVEHAWDKLREYLPAIALKYPKLLETVMLSIFVDYRKSFTQLIEEFSKLLPTIRPNKRYQASTLLLQLPFAHRSIRDFYDFADESVRKIVDRSFSPFLYDLYKTMQLCILSALSLEKNRIDEALDYALQAAKAVSDRGSPELIFCTHNHLCAVYLAMGNEVLLNKALSETERFIEKNNAHYLYRNFLAWKTKILLFDANKKAAEDWLENYFVSDDEKVLGKVPLYKVFQYFTTVRACLVLNMSSRALILIEALIQFAKDYRRPLDLAEALTLKASLEWASGSSAEAAASLEKALIEMQGRNFIRIIADEGSAVIPILKRIFASICKKDYKGNLTRAYITEVILAAHIVSKRHRGITANFKKISKIVKLSKQQKKMIELLSHGYKNQEIAKLCNLAIPTVKGHLLLAYEKLEVNNAMDAVLKARELGLVASG